MEKWKISNAIRYFTIVQRIRNKKRALCSLFVCTEGVETMLLTVKDLQKRIPIGRDAAYALMHSKAFPSIKIGGRYFVDNAALEKWIEQYTFKEFYIKTK